jgi:hypothetical protein
MKPLIKRKQMSSLRVMSIAVLIVLLGSTQTTQAAEPFTLVALPDTQNETEYYPAVLTSEIQWIVNNRAERNIAFVGQQGDLTNNANSTEFATAHNNLFMLNGADGLPWGTAPGNHDLANPSLYDSYFGPANFSGRSWYGGSYSHSSYQTFQAGGRNYLVLDIEYDAPNEVLDWAQGVIDGNPGAPTIINTHDYMTFGGRTGYGDALFSGAITGEHPNPDGLINGNSQVFMVLCGHMHYEYSQTTMDIFNKPVFELLADYQDGPYGGNGGNAYMRLYQFDEAGSSIHVTTFSPYDLSGGSAGTCQTGPSSQFDLTMNFNDRLGNAVPEPAACALAIAGLLGFALASRTGKSTSRGRSPCRCESCFFIDPKQ